MMKLTAASVLLIALAGCATSAGGLYETDIKKTVLSSKSPQSFATCVAEAFSGDVQLRSEGERYWVLRIIGDVPRHRWDFTPTDSGSQADLRSTGLIGSGEGDVQVCA